MESSEIDGDNVYPDITVETYIKKNEPGTLLKLLKKGGIITEEDEIETVALKVKCVTMLVEIKNAVDDYDQFLETFGISKDEQLNTELSDLIDQYGLEMTAIKDYVNDHLK